MSAENSTSPTGQSALAALRLDQLTVPREKSYHTAVLIISILAWLVLVITVIGLFYGALIAFLLWLGNGLLIASLRAEAVRVSEEQLPDLHRTLTEVCARLGVQKVPALYVVQAGGMLNAFATRFAGRDFVVVYAEFLAALGADSPEMRFVLGHEVGHLQSRHIWKQMFLAPGMLAPLIGAAYRRSWESSCDRYGAYAAQDIGGATRAMMIISGGARHGAELKSPVFARQHTEERGFFVSLHELISTYPTLSRRVADLEALGTGAAPATAPRHPLAYLVALMLPPGGGGAGGAIASLFMMIFVIGLLSAMAIPAFAKVRENAELKACTNNQRMIAAALDQYRLENKSGAKSWDAIAGPGKLLPSMPLCLKHGEYAADHDETSGYQVTCSVHSVTTR